MRTSLVLLLLAAILPAQASALLAIEKPQDRTGRDRVYELLAGRRIDVAFDAASPKDVARVLTAASGDRVDFVALDAVPSAKPLTLELHRVPMTTVLDQVQRQIGVRLVYRGGVVLLADPARVHEHLSLRVFDVRTATTPLPSFPGPELALSRGDDALGAAEVPGPAPPPSGLTADELVDLVQKYVLPESWDHGASIVAVRGVLFVRQSEEGQRQVRDLLQRLGVIPAPPAPVIDRRPTPASTR